MYFLCRCWKYYRYNIIEAINPLVSVKWRTIKGSTLFLLILLLLPDCYVKVLEWNYILIIWDDLVFIFHIEKVDNIRQKGEKEGYNYHEEEKLDIISIPFPISIDSVNFWFIVTIEINSRNPCLIKIKAFNFFKTSKTEIKNFIFSISVILLLLIYRTNYYWRQWPN